jgi:transmembrane sensor
MIDRSLFNVEDFLVDNTFQLYCAGTDKLCIAYWENYIKQHPEQTHIIKEARRLYTILSGNKKPLNQQLELLKENLPRPEEQHIIPIRKNYTWLRIAAAVILIAGVSILYRNSRQADIPKKNLIARFTTGGGERKKIILLDGSVVLLNAKSSLTVNEDFNESKREVNLVGEAFFDVKHNKNKPFQVHTSDFDINVLGTSFNVKVYPDEATSEAVLIKGLIVMEGKGSKGNSIIMKPSQKVTFYKKEIARPGIKTIAKPADSHPQIIINQYTKVNDGTIVEMAWTRNQLEILDQSFCDLKSVLERWYDVDIRLNDKDIERYRFTATFNGETIEEVLIALQKAEHFKYEIKGKQITISK